MIIKDNFRLIKNVPNVLNISDTVIKTYSKEENNPRNIFTFLKQREKNIKNHFTKKTIFNLIEDIKKRESIKVVSFENYLLPVTYSPSSDSMIINLKPMDVEDITDLSPNNLYALLVYAYAFRQFIKKVKLGENVAGPIIAYYLSMFIKLFGKEFGLLGIYASGIPKLKFMVACYILCAFFGNKNDIKLYKRASSVAPYDFSEEINQLKSYDFTDITQFIKALSDLRVLTGIKIYGFTTKVYRFLDISFMPALEDLSRFICILLTSDIKGSTVVRSFLYTYNDNAFRQIIEISKKAFK